MTLTRTLVRAVDELPGARSPRRWQNRYRDLREAGMSGWTAAYQTLADYIEWARPTNPDEVHRVDVILTQAVRDHYAVTGQDANEVRRDDFERYGAGVVSE